MSTKYDGECPMCGESEVTEEDTEEEVPYGSQVILRVVVPTMTCPDCGFVFTDLRGEELRTAAIDEYKAKHGAPP